MVKLNLIATAAFGLESVVALELKNLGINDVMVENGKVQFFGDYSTIARTNLWLRTADRVLIKAGEFYAESFEELFEKTKALPWEEFLPENANFPVTGKAVRSRLMSVSDCQAIVKKAIVERLKGKYRLNWFPEDGPEFKIEVSLLKDLATLTIDTSGAGLHKRGYRKLTGRAPLRETLAAALVILSRWREDRALADPFCGSGTIPVEAALIGLNIAPGVNREFAFTKWPWFPKKELELAREEARSKQRNLKLLIYGSDISEDELSYARYHAKAAGVEKSIRFFKKDFREVKFAEEYGWLISNLPYGERIGDGREVEKLYRELKILREKLPTWSFYFLSSHPAFEKLYGRKADKRRKLYNGKIETHFYQFFGPKSPKIIL
ncbi:THUMP domain-containing class I SAM-dependent RNA methyltransferase [Carboxydothermus islandicus]|uniref:THUMP domain-containing class I SAM-dependent RNA methyltransferase n=1 Tax=Carboxydothermus islandicus TaxID=661089 RepID=UPI00096A91BB|nr:class I SAM-dependent RNA methyltransferase [Carboxydothermus islandicus]